MKFVNEFEFDSIEKGKIVYDAGYNLIKEKGYVTCEDMYKMINKSLLPYSTDKCPDIYKKHGWTDFSQAMVTYSETSMNCILILPQVRNIENIIKMKEGEINGNQENN